MGKATGVLAVDGCEGVLFVAWRDYGVASLAEVQLTGFAPPPSFRYRVFPATPTPHPARFHICPVYLPRTVVAVHAVVIQRINDTVSNVDYR